MRTYQFFRIVVVLIFTILGIIGLIQEAFNLGLGTAPFGFWERLLTTALRNLAPELAGISLAFATLDYLNEKRQTAFQHEFRKSRLREELMSNNPVAALAASQLISEGLFEEVLESIGRNLRRCEFTGAKLQGQQLSEVNFSDGKLDKAVLSNSTLRKARLLGTSLIEAELFGVDLSGADLTLANCTGADMSKCQFLGANFVSTNFADAKLAGADLRQTDLRFARFQQTEFSDAILEDSHLSDLDLSGCNFVNANLRRASLQKSNLKSANMMYADLSECDLADTNLIGVNFRRATLSGVDLQNARYDNTTQWPENFEPLRHGARFVIQQNQTTYIASLGEKVKSWFSEVITAL